MQYLETWRQLSTANRIAALAALAVTVLMISMLINTATKPPMALLYSGLDPSAAGEILEALEAMDTRSEVRGDAIYVPEPQRDATRMALAREGLPRQSQAGFEILDDLNGFATSSELFDATYWRAKEGELARTILATEGVKSARVHIAVPKKSAFVKETLSPSAVVTASMGRGQLDAGRAAAMRLVVALAVPGLAPDQVAVLDAAGGVILAPGPDDAGAVSGSRVTDREKVLEQDLVGLLEARVGPGNARVKVMLAVSEEQEVRHERVLDPERRILTSRESTESSEQGTDGAGVVTVASNLPDGDAASTTTPAQSKRNETSENTRFDVSEIRTETVTAPGALKRVHVAVLINDEPITAEDGSTTIAKRSEPELEALRNLVEAAVGFDASRGDVVTIESMPFNQPAPLGAAATKNAIQSFFSNNLMLMLQLLIPAAVSLILGLFVLRPLLTGAKTPLSVEATNAASPQAPALSAPIAATTATTLPVNDLQRLASEQRTAATAVLKNWLEQTEPSR
ncbi:MAG: flagellar basal-body MS-ring/collar protein FliF [Parvularculaceae bacterium]